MVGGVWSCLPHQEDNRGWSRHNDIIIRYTHFSDQIILSGEISRDFL